MTMIPEAIPEVLRSGETTKISRAFDDYSASDGWAYALYLNGATSVLTKSGVAQPDGSFLVTIAATDVLAEGIYRFVERVSKGGEVYSVGDGNLVVELDLATAPAGATLSHYERTLKIIEAAIEGRLTKDQQSFTIAGRAVIKIPAMELLKMRGIYASLAYRDQNPGKLGTSVEIQFASEEEGQYPPTWTGSVL